VAAATPHRRRWHNQRADSNATAHEALVTCAGSGYPRPMPTTSAWRSRCAWRNWPRAQTSPEEVAFSGAAALACPGHAMAVRPRRPPGPCLDMTRNGWPVPSAALPGPRNCSPGDGRCGRGAWSWSAMWPQCLGPLARRQRSDEDPGGANPSKLQPCKAAATNPWLRHGLRPARRVDGLRVSRLQPIRAPLAGARPAHHPCC